MVHIEHLDITTAAQPLKVGGEIQLKKLTKKDTWGEHEKTGQCRAARTS